MKPMHAALTGALIAGVAMFAIGTRAAQRSNDMISAAAQPLGFVSSTPAAPTAQLVRTSAPVRTVYQPVAQRHVTRQATRVQYVETRPHRSWQKSALIIGGSAA